MPASSLFDQLRDQSRPSFEPEPLDTSRITKDVDTRLAKEASDYQKGQETAAKDAAKQQVQGLKEKGYTVVHDETGAPTPLTAPNGEPVRRKSGSRIHVGEQTGDFYEPDLQKGGLKPAVGQKKTDKNGRIIEDFGGGLVKDHGEDPAWAKRKEDKTLLTKAEVAIRDKMMAPPPDDVVKVKKDYSKAQKDLAKAEKDLEIDKTDKDYIAAHAAAKEALDKLTPQNEAINQWSKAKAGLHGQLAQVNAHRKLLREGAFTDENRKQWQSVVAPPAAPQPASVTPPAPTAGSSGQAALQASQQPMSVSPTAAPTAPVAVQPQNTPPVAAPAPVVAAPQPNAVAAPITPAPREQLVTPEAVADLPIDAHSSAIQASAAALKQNAAALQQQQDAINAPVAAVDAKMAQWQVKSQAALATGDAAISMMQLDGTMSPLFAASTKKELQDLYSERQEAEKKVAPQLEELNGAWAAHQEDVDAHNQAVESLNGKVTAQENERRSNIEKMREQPALAPYADKINALDKETAENNAKIDSASWDENAKEAARAGLKASYEAKLKDINKSLNRGFFFGLAQKIYANTTDAEQKKQVERTRLENYDAVAGDYTGPTEKELSDKYDSPVNAKVASALQHAGLSQEEIKPYIEDVKSLDFGRNQKESALLSDGNLVVNPKNYLREDDYKSAVQASGADSAQKQAALDRFPKLQAKAADSLYSSIRETDPALLKREVDVMPGETDADKMTAYMNRGYLPRLWTQIRAEVGAGVSGLEKGVAGIAAAVAGVIEGGYKALGLSDLATGEVSDYLHEKALGFAKDQQSDSQVAESMRTGAVGTVLSKAAGFIPDLAAMGGIGKIAQSVRFLTGAGSKTIEGIDAATAATRAATAAGDVSKGMEAYGQLLKAQGVTEEAIGEKIAALKDKLAPFGTSPLPGDVLVAMEEVGGKKLTGLVAKEAGTGANAAAAYFAGKGGGETYVDAYDKNLQRLTAKGVDPEQAKVRARASALLPALVNGAITYALFKNKSLGDITDNALETEAMLKRSLGDVLKSIGEHAAVDAGKLGLDTLAHGIVAKATYDPEKSPASILEESLQSALTGAVMGGLTRAVHEFAIRNENKNDIQGAEPTDDTPEPSEPPTPPSLSPSGLPPEIHTAASDAEISANTNGGDAERASVLRDIATGAKVSTMTEGELNAVGLTHNGDKVVPMTGKDAPPPAVQIDGKGNAIILQPAIDELRATFPATADMIGMDEKTAREYFTNGKPDTRPTEPVVENAAETTPAVAAEQRVEPTPSREVAAKPELKEPVAPAKPVTPAVAATVARAAAIAEKKGDIDTAKKLRAKIAAPSLDPKVVKVIDGIVTRYKGLVLIGETEGRSGIEFDTADGKIRLDLNKIHETTHSYSPNEVIAFVEEAVDNHEKVHVIAQDPEVSTRLDKVWSLLDKDDKIASAQAYYRNGRNKFPTQFKGKHEFLVQLVQTAKKGELEPAIAAILKKHNPDLYAAVKELFAALIARLKKMLTDSKHKAYASVKDLLTEFEKAEARLFPQEEQPPVPKEAAGGQEGAALKVDRKEKVPFTKDTNTFAKVEAIINDKTAEKEADEARRKDKIGEAVSALVARDEARKPVENPFKTELDKKAHEAAASPHNDLTPPTPAQIDADNYKVGKVRLAGEDISIETPAGAQRRPEWPALKDHYGRILGTKGADGELLDIFIKEGTPLDWNGPVFVVNQNKADGTFDETKAIAGASSVAEARDIYKRNYSKGWKGLGGIVKYDSLKQWVDSDHSGKAVKKGKTEPVAARVSVSPATDELLGKNNRGEPVYWSDNAKTHYSISNGRVQTSPWIEGLPDSAIDRLHELHDKKGLDVKPVNVKTGGMETPQQIVIPPAPPKPEVVQPPAPPQPESTPALIAEVKEALAPEITPQAQGGIMGYSWDAIKGAQQGSALAHILRGAPVKPKANVTDWKLLEQHGADWLYDHEQYGVLDRLGLPMTRPTNIKTPSVTTSKDTLFELPPRARSLSGMRDAVRRKLVELERDKDNEKFPSDKSRGVRADDWKIVERDGKFIIQEKFTGEEDLGFPTYDTRAEAEAKVKAENDANTLDNRTIVDGETKLEERINRLRNLLGKIETAMAPHVASRAIFDKNAKPFERAPAVPKPRKTATENKTTRDALKASGATSVVKAAETPEKPTVAPEIAPVVERPYGPPDETGKSGTETREGKNPNEAKVVEPPTLNEQPTNPTQSPTPAEGQSAGGVVEGEEGKPTAQEWKALHEEHQALLTASKNNPQAWKPKEWQAHRAELMKREAESRKVPAIWTHNELVTTTGKYEIDHETGELTKLQPLSETGYQRNVDSMFKDGIPESGIDGGNKLAREMWEKVKKERAEAAQRKADAIAEAEAAEKAKAEEQAKLDKTKGERREAFETAVGTSKFKTVKFTNYANKEQGGYQLGRWIVSKGEVIDAESKLRAFKNLSNDDARKAAQWLNFASEGNATTKIEKDTPFHSKILETVKAFDKNDAPSWFTSTAASPKETDKPPASSDVVNTNQATRDKLKAAGSPSIADFGEKIHGARKDVWGTFKKSFSDELPADAANITLSKNFPEPDYEKAISQGIPVDTLATFKAIRDLIPPKPRKGWKLKQWAEIVRGMHKHLGDIINGDGISPERLHEISMKAGGKVSDRINFYKDLGFPAFTKAADWQILDNVSSWNFKGVKSEKPVKIMAALYKDRFTNLEALMEDGRKGYVSVLDQVRDRINNAPAAPAAEKKVDFSIYSDRFTKDVFIGKKAINGVVRLKTGFPDPKSARQYLADNQEALAKQWEGLKAHPDYRRPINQPRQGPVRREGDVSPQMFGESFGFRGVQFGNWVEDERRQVDLNEAYDALVDLADALGVPAKALSLDGSLGLAFGARGSGGTNAAAAHYEPGQVVINLTKKAGPGSLAHEWFHAFDNYFARLDKLGTTEPKTLDEYATREKRTVSNLRPEIYDAFRKIRQAVSTGEFAERSKKLDEARSKPYYGTTIEKAARAFERYVVDRLEGKEVFNDYLVNIRKDDSPALPTTAEMKGGITQAYDALFNALDTTETEKGVKLQASPITSEQDAEYLKAAESGDMETAQRMVDEAAKAAGYEIRYRAGSGYLNDDGFLFLAEDPEYASNFGKDVDKFYVKPVNTLDLTQWKADADVSHAAFTKALQENGVDISGLAKNSGEPLQQISQRSEKKGTLAKAIRDAGFDSLRINEYYEGGGKNESLAMLDDSDVEDATNPITRDASGRIIPLSERFNLASDSILYASNKNHENIHPASPSARLQTPSPITSEQDAEYLKAAESGDMETAQRMVDEAANKAGYNTSDTFYSGARKQGHIISELGDSLFVTDNYDAAKDYAHSQNEPQSFYLKGDIAEQDDIGIDWKSPKWSEFDLDGDGSNIDLGGLLGHRGLRQIIAKATKSAGFSALHFAGDVSSNAQIMHDSWLVVDPLQIKSADPITRDAEGKVIPLSQRFNPASDSILYSPTPDDQLLSYNWVVQYLTENNLPVTITREEWEQELGEQLPAGTRREVTDTLREQEDWKPYLSGEPRSFKDVLWPEALDAIKKDPFKGTKLVDSILAKPRVLSDTDRAVLTHEFLRRRQDYNAATNAIMSATPENKLEAEQDLARARDAYFAVTEAADRSGSEAGRALNAIRLALKEDYSPARIEARFRAAKGSALNEAELKHAAELAQAHKERDDALEEVRAKQDQLKALEVIIHSYEHGATAKPDLSRIKKAAKAGSEWIKAKMAAMFSRTTLEASSPADEASEQLAAVGAALIEDGANTLEAFSKAFEELHPGALAAFNKDAAVIFEASKSKLAEENAAVLKDTTPTGITNKIKGKREEITDLKASDLNNLALAIVQHEGVSDVDTLRSKMHERLEEIFPHITERDVAKAWTGFEKAVYPSNDPFRKIVSDLRSQEQLILTVQVLIEEERLAAKSGRQFPPRTDAQRKLIREYNDLVKASGLTTSDPATQLASTQSRIIKALRNRKADLEAQVKAKKREVRTSSTTTETPEMKRLRDEIAALNAKLDLLDPRNTGPTDAQKVKLAENGLKKSLENVDKEIAELERKVKNKDLSEPTPDNTKTVPWSTVIAERRRDLAAKRTLRNDLANQLDDLRDAAKPVADPLMNVLSKWEQRQNLATVKAAPRTKSRLEELAKRYLSAEEPSHRFVEDAMNLGLSQGDAQDAQLILDAERNRRESVALAALKRRNQRSIEHNAAKAQAFDEDSPLVRKSPAAKKLDKEADDLYLKRKLAEREVKRAEEKFRLRNRDPLRKAADFAVKWRRGFILADYVVLYKLGMAAAWRTVFTPIEEGIGAGISAAMPGLSKNAPREYGASVRAEAEAITEGLRYLVNNFRKVLKHGISSIDAKYSDKPDFNDLDPSYSDYIGNMHAAIKLLPKANEFYRSFRKRTEAAIRNGQDATSPGAVQAIGAAAYLDAQRAIFMNPNFVSEAWRSAITKLRKTETSSNWAKVTADVLEAALPIVKVPTNILFETLGSYVGGILRETPFAVKSAAKAATNFDGQGFAKRFQDEYSKLPPEQAEAVLRHLKKGAFGNALMLLVMLTGATAAKLIGGLWTPDDKREAWQVKPERFRLSEDSKDLRRWIAHNPVFDTLHFAVTAHHYAEKAANASKAIAAKAEVEVAEAERRMHKSHSDAKNFLKAKLERDAAQKKLEAARKGGDPNSLAWAMAVMSGLTTSSLALVEKAPLIGNVGQFLDAIPEDKKGDYLKKELAASIIPTGVTNIAKGGDEGADGEPIKRKMESWLDHFKNRIPGLRETLPFKDGPTDEFGFKRSEAHTPIPAEKAIENFNKKNPDVKYHLPKISKASLDDLPDENSKTAFQIRVGELMRKFTKEGVTKTDVVNEGTKNDPKWVSKTTVEIPPISEEEGLNPTLKSIEKLKFMHRKAVSTAKPEAERPNWTLSYLDKYRSSATK